jgi:hypothetical protein
MRGVPVVIIAIGLGVSPLSAQDVKFSTDSSITLIGRPGEIRSVLDRLEHNGLLNENARPWRLYVFHDYGRSGVLDAVRRACPTCSEVDPIPAPVNPCTSPSGERHHRHLGNIPSRMSSGDPKLGGLKELGEARDGISLTANVRDMRGVLFGGLSGSENIAVQIPNIRANQAGPDALGAVGGYAGLRNYSAMRYQGSEIGPAIKRICPECNEVDPIPEPVPVSPNC